MHKKKIVLFGSSGLIGNILFRELQKNYSVITINRAQLNDISNKLIKKRVSNCVCIINCAYDYSDLGIQENINYEISKKIIQFKEFNKINRLINLSSLSVHKSSVSNYSLVKRNIEKIFENYTGCYSIRLGLPTLNSGYIGIIKKIRILSALIFFISINFKFKNPIYQRISNLDDFIIFIDNFINNSNSYPSIFSFSSPLLVDFNTLLKTFSYGVNVSIQIKTIRRILRIIQSCKIYFPFSEDNLLGLIYSPTKLECKNYE